MRLPSGAVAVLLLALAWALVSQRSQEPSSDHGAAGTPASTAANSTEDGGAQGEGATYIVRFTSYKMAADHKAALAGALKSPGAAWRWVPRHNPAAALPTDFGLLHLPGRGAEAVKVRRSRQQAGRRRSRLHCSSLRELAS